MENFVWLRWGTHAGRLGGPPNVHRKVGVGMVHDKLGKVITPDNKLSSCSMFDRSIERNPFSTGSQNCTAGCPLSIARDRKA